MKTAAFDSKRLMALMAWVVAGGLAFVVGQARAADVYWSVGVHTPDVRVRVGNTPTVVVATRPLVMHTPQVIYAPPVVYSPPVVVYPGGVRVYQTQPWGYQERDWYDDKHAQKHARRHRHHDRYDDRYGRFRDDD